MIKSINRNANKKRKGNGIKNIAAPATAPVNMDFIICVAFIIIILPGYLLRRRTQKEITLTHWIILKISFGMTNRAF